MLLKMMRWAAYPYAALSGVAGALVLLVFMGTLAQSSFTYFIATVVIAVIYWRGISVSKAPNWALIAIAFSFIAANSIGSFAAYTVAVNWLPAYSFAVLTLAILFFRDKAIYDGLLLFSIAIYILRVPVWPTLEKLRFDSLASLYPAVYSTFCLFAILGLSAYLITRIFNELRAKPDRLTSLQSLLKREFHETLQSIGWLELLGLAGITASIFALYSQSGVHFSDFAKAFVETYNNFLVRPTEPLVKAIVLRAGFTYSDAYPKLLIIAFLCIRAANIRSKQLGERGIWAAIKSEARTGRSAYFSSTTSRVIAPTTAIFLISHLILDLAGVNPIAILAPEGKMTLESMTYVSFLGFFSGLLANIISGTADRGVQLAQYILVFFRLVIWLPALVLVAPLVAWRVVLISLLIFAAIVSLGNV